MLRASCVLAEQSNGAKSDDWPPPLVRWARGVRAGDQIAKALLLLLVSYADPDGGNCFPAVPTLARDMEVSERTVQRKLKLLEDEGHVLRKPQHRAADGARKSSVFTFPPFEQARERAARRDTAVTPPVTLRSPQDHHNYQETPKAPQMHNRVRRPYRPRKKKPPVAAEAPQLPVGLEGHDATRFRERAIAILGDATYRSHLANCHIGPEDDGLVIKTRYQPIADDLREGHRANRLRSVARELGIAFIRVEGPPAVNVRSPDPKVADAARQAEAIRGGRVAGAALPTGGLGRG